MNDLVLAYEHALADGRLRPDAAQRDAVARMAGFAASLSAPARGGLLSRLRGKAGAGPHGFYLYGQVGRGKTMLMDLFFSAAPVERKRRVHFHAFMLEVHDALHDLRVSGKREKGMDDALMQVAGQIAQSARLLCFDEFQVRDVADAMILGRLFTALFDRGVRVVMTSNIAPDDLYHDGLQRDRFLPFIALLKEKLDVIRFDGETDYRLRRLQGQPVYFTPHDADAAAELEKIFAAMSDNAEGEAAEIALKGRKLHIPRSCHGVAMFHFDEICGINASAADYLALAKDYRFVIVSDVPVFSDKTRDIALRFVMLVDALYDAHRFIALSAAALPEKLYKGGAMQTVFDRTASRLHEMQSRQYRRE